MSIRRSTDRSRPARRDKTVTRSYAVLRRAAPPLLRARGPDGAPPFVRTVLIPRENGTCSSRERYLFAVRTGGTLGALPRLAGMGALGVSAGGA